MCCRDRDTTERRRFHPQRLVHYRNNWYLVAYCERAQDLRNFSLDRITRPVDTGAPAEAVDSERLTEHLSSGFGIFGGPATHEAVLWFSPAAARWVADEQWHPQQRDTRAEDGLLERRVRYSDPTEIVMEALRCGPDCEVLAPEALRSMAVERLRAALGNYSDGA